MPEKEAYFHYIGDRCGLDHWIDARTFHWQAQNKTTPSSKRGREVIGHTDLGIGLHLFVRERPKLAGGKAAPFVYHGRVRYLRHEGSGPMSVVLGVGECGGNR